MSPSREILGRGHAAGARLSVARPLHAELLYHVLSHLDLGDDAASLANPARCDLDRPWIAPLHAAYAAAPGRLALQVLPLVCHDLPGMIVALVDDRIDAFCSPAGRELALVAVDAIADRLASVTRYHRATQPAARARIIERLPWLECELAPLLRQLWREAARPALSLRLVDCSSLERRGGTHGRATTVGGQKRVAVSFAAPREALLCQILHEVVHSVTDPLVRRRFGVLKQATARASAGYRLHRALERTAVAYGERVIERSRPRLLGAYREWRRSYGV